MINIGSKENPVFVPDEAAKPETPEGREWWNDLASGSVILESEDLDRLLKLTTDEK